MQGYLRASGINLQRQKVRDSLKRVDPSGTLERWATAVKRRQYHVATPNSLWHGDAHCKMNKWVVSWFDIQSLFTKIFPDLQTICLMILSKSSDMHDVEKKIIRHFTLSLSINGHFFQMIRQYVWWFVQSHQTFCKIISNVWWADAFSNSALSKLCEKSCRSPCLESQTHKQNKLKKIQLSASGWRTGGILERWRCAVTHSLRVWGWVTNCFILGGILGSFT